MYEFMGIQVNDNLDEILDIIWDYLDILDDLEENKNGNNEDSGRRE